MISIVVPVLNEAPRLPAMFEMLDAQPGEKQIILADGGSTDDTHGVAEGRALIVESEPGRARQMNAGAAHATSETILFLHCD
ncbi:MAG: glycosyltransferase, partial [Nitrospinae bacterium]|nr:glycosyltransferase [Nitrospinota bacterium]